jgi:hypothetical protein
VSEEHAPELDATELLDGLPEGEPFEELDLNESDDWEVTPS